MGSNGSKLTYGQTSIYRREETHKFFQEEIPLAIPFRGKGKEGEETGR
jgi:hypothetical protein